MNGFKKYIRQDGVENIVSFSGGKDSTALYLLALEWGLTFRPVFADTGHEHEKTYDFVQTLHEKTGGPKIEIIRADFSDKFEKRREFIRDNWGLERVTNFAPNKKYPKGRRVVSPPVPQERINRAIELMFPTGNPFLDLCMLKGRFPSTKARFCTEELKSLPMQRQIMFPAVKKRGWYARRVISWQGVRAEESEARRKLDRFGHCDSGAVIWRPILDWTHEDVFAMHRKHNVQPNPLYFEGMGRVGCFPCVMCNKSELSSIAARYPDHIERVAEWEKIVSECSRLGMATFFPDNKTTKTDSYDVNVDGYLGIHAVAEWAKTTRGGVQYDLMNFSENEDQQCQSKYGLCECYMEKSHTCAGLRR